MTFASSESTAPARNVRIIIPAHNEAGRLHETIGDLFAYFGPRATLLVVANGCSDETGDVARALARRYHTVELLEIPQRIGKGGAVRAGMTFGKEPYVAFVDADGSTAADQLDILINACIERRLSGAIGSRWLPGSRIARKQPFQRRLASRAFNTVTRLVFGLPFSDTQCGAKVFERAALDGVLDTLEIANFAFDVDLLLALKKAGKPVAEIAISWQDVVEYSKVRLVRSGPAMLWALLRLFIRDTVVSRLPFADAVGRSQTIPVLCGLDILFLVSRRHEATDAFTAVLSGIQRRGHFTRVVRVDSFAALGAFVLWYVRSGHRLSHAIVHDRRGFSSRLIALSAKPKFSLQTIEREVSLDPAYLDTFIHQVEGLTHRSHYFRRGDSGWTYSTQRLEASTIESVSTASGS